MKILNGNYKRDTGTICIDGKEVNVQTPNQAKAEGISIIFQELNLIPSISIAENIFLGRLPCKGGVVDRKTLEEKTRKALSRVGLGDMDPKSLVGTYSVAQQQMIEIARALSYDETKIILMDEPTATLTKAECDVLFDVIRSLKKEGMTVIYISHKMEEIFEICDRITIIRDGKVIDTAPLGEITVRQITEKMVGREITDQFPKRPKLARMRKRCCALRIFPTRTSTRISPSASARARCWPGRPGRRRTHGDRPRPVQYRFPRQRPHLYPRQGSQDQHPMSAIRHGLCYLSEDRKTEGLMGTLSVRLNLTASNLDSVMKRGVLSARREKEVTGRLVKRLDVRTPSLEQRTENLSAAICRKSSLASGSIRMLTSIFSMNRPGASTLARNTRSTCSSTSWWPAANRSS